jgi:apolipoprotein N-acyltransferase
VEVATVPDRFVSVSGKANVAHEKTFYAQTGDWFAWFCVAMFVALVASQLSNRLRRI